MSGAQDVAAVIAAPAARAMRERKPGPPLLESGKPDPPGKAKPPRKAGGSSKRGKTAKTRGGAKGGQSKTAAAAKANVGTHGAVDHGRAGGDDLPMLQMAEDAGPVNMQDEDEDDGALFCVCLGKDDGTPMILCESCENWFHFPCIHLDPEEAKNIAAFYCNVCEQAGSGKTQWNPQLSAPPSQSISATSSSFPVNDLPPLPPLPPVQTPSDSGNDTDGDYFARKDAKYGGHSTDEDYAEGEGPSSANKRKRGEQPQRRKSGTMGTSTSANAGKRRKGVIEDDDDREERRKHQKKSSMDQSRFYGSTSSGSGGSGKEQPAENNKTRKHAIDQLELSFKTIFSASPSATPDPSSSSALATETASPSPDRAKAFASSVEADLFLNYHEIDEKDKKTKIPGRKYISKFRTMNFNLKGNEYFRSRIATGLLDEKAIVNMAQEDLLTPEARAEQEALKTRSLAQSVKVTVAQPKVKMTHKGEEVIDEFDSAMMKDASNKISLEQHEREREENDNSFMSDMRERSRSMSLAAGSPGGEQSPRFGSPSAMSPMVAQSPFQRAFSPVVEMGPPALRHSTSGYGIAASPGKGSDGGESDAASRRPSFSHHARSDSISKSKLDLDSIWGAYKAPSESPAKDAEEEDGDGKAENEDDADVGQEQGMPERAATLDEFDPFSFSQKDKRNTDEDFDAIMNLDAIEASTSEAKPDIKAEEEKPDKTVDLPTIWEGTVVHPDEGDFPARIVQVGGTSLGAHPHIWNQILPKGKIELSGRIEVKPAAEYLVQAKFAPKREVIVLALIPGQGDIGEEKAKEGQARLIKFLHEKKRYGVAPPSAELKAVTKDHYLVPLKKDDPLPDYIELLDDFALGETGTRTKDYLLSILVLSKGAWLGSAATSAPAKPAGSSTPVPQGNSPRRDPRPQASSQLAPPKAPTPLAASQPTPIPSYASPLNQYGNQPAFQPQTQQFNPQQQQLLQQAANPNLPALDPNALQSLLSNPSLLQALNAGPAQTNNFANSVPPLQANMPFHPSQQAQYQANIPQNTPPWAGGHQPQPWQQQQAPMNNNWNPAGSPPWQGGQPSNSQSGWGGSGPGAPGMGPPPQQYQGGPGFIHPDRIKQASMEAAEIAAREQRDRDRRGGGGGYGRRDSGDRNRSDRDRDRDRSGRDDGGYSRTDARDRDGRRPRNSDFTKPRNGGGRDGRDRDRDRDGGNTRGGRNSASDAGTNQMNAGISDRGWGNRR